MYLSISEWYIAVFGVLVYRRMMYWCIGVVVVWLCGSVVVATKLLSKFSSHRRVGESVSRFIGVWVYFVSVLCLYIRILVYWCIGILVY